MSLLAPIDPARRTQLNRIAAELGLKNWQEVVNRMCDEFILNHPAPKTFEERRHEKHRQLEAERRADIIRNQRQ